MLLFVGVGGCRFRSVFVNCWVWGINKLWSFINGASGCAGMFLLQYLAKCVFSPPNLLMFFASTPPAASAFAHHLLEFSGIDPMLAAELGPAPGLRRPVQNFKGINKDMWTSAQLLKGISWHSARVLDVS